MQLLWQEHAQPKYIRTIRKLFSLLADALLAPDGRAAYIPITLVTILIFIGSSWQIFLPTTDPARYQCYALTFWFGSNATSLLPAAQCDFLKAAITQAQPPFHMLPLEYPPLTLLPFSLALLLPLSYYQLAIAFIMALTAVFIYWLLLQYAPRGAALAFTLSLFVGALATAQRRFDLIPAAFTLLCVIAAERKHWTAAYFALACGVLFKIYPILLLPALFLAEQRAYKLLSTPPPSLSLKTIPQHLWFTVREIRLWRWKNMLICLGTILSVTGFFALLNFQGAVVNQISYFLDRPLQVESIGSTLLWLASGLGFPFTINNLFGSLNIVSGLSTEISLLGTLSLIAGFLYCMWMQWRGKFDIVQAMLALLFVFIATGKVFSPQYLIWLMPLVAYAGAFDLFWIFWGGAILLLTTYTYIILYTRPVTSLLNIPLLPGFFETVGVRNAFLVVLTLAYLFNWFHARQRRPLPQVLGGKITQPLKDFWASR